LVRSTLGKNKLDYRTVRREAHKGERTTWERAVYASAFNNYFNPAVELPVPVPATADTAAPASD
jgi:hypothetical protein